MSSKVSMIDVWAIVKIWKLLIGELGLEYKREHFRAPFLIQHYHFYLLTPVTFSVASPEWKKARAKIRSN